MCINDWRAGRLISHQVTTASIAAGPLTILANQNRVGITIQASAEVGFGESATISAGGVLWGIMYEEFAKFHVTLLDHGDLPTVEWIITNVAGMTNISVTEYFMPEAYLAAGLDEFISHYARHHDAIGR